MTEKRRPTNEKVQPGREGEFRWIVSQPHGNGVKHHELELAKLEGLRIEVSTMTAAQAARAIELLASIGLELWKREKGSVYRKDLDEQDAVA